MEEFFTATLSFPTVVFTVLLACTILYWMLVILGALGMDVLDFDGGADGAADGAVEGAADGAVEGAAHGAAEGVHHDGVDGGVMGSMLSAMRVRNVPVTVVLSLVVFFSWLLCHVGSHVMRGVGPSWAIDGGLFVGAFALALPITAIAARPLSRFMKEERAAQRRDLIGKIVRIDTSRVDARFGTALAPDDGAGLIVQVRCDGDNTLSRGASALVLSYDEAREAYEVAPMDDLIASETRRES